MGKRVLSASCALSCSAFCYSLLTLWNSVSYFTTSIPGAGIFLPLSKALRRDPSTPFPATPSTAGLRTGSQNSTNYTPPTPGLPKFSASVGPGARAPSPAGKRPGTSGGRLSLPRPESPIRRTQMTPGPRPSFGAPSAAKTPGRHASPTSNRFAQSVRGTAGDPNKRTLDRKPSMPVRSASALGFDDDPPVPALPRTQTNGSTASFRNQTRSPSRNAPRGGASDEQLELLRSQLEDRERQLRDQSATLAEMESSLTELQTLMMHADGPGGAAANNAETEGKDVTQLRALLREKNDKIAMLTSEFDSHRADFRSTIDALEMASTETERVYEKRMEELMADVRELESRNLDVDSVASQLKQLEELVQELEEGLEDARRGEAEARGEVEFLRGEVERTRTELLREREKSGSPATGSGHRKSTSASMSAAMASKELEAREDEIRGLKAIIHSLSRDSAGGGAGSRGSAPPAQRRGSILPGDVIEHKIARDNLERQVAELQGILKEKTSREEELEQELEKMRAAGGGAGGATPQQPQRPLSTQRSSYRDSRDTVVLTRSPIEEPPTPVVPAAAIVNGSGNVDKPNHADDDNVNGGNSGLGLHNLASNQHRRGPMLDATAESDAHSNATENSTLWCEICEAPGHDILTCTNMFGPDGGASSSKTGGGAPGTTDGGLGVDDGAHPAPLSPLKTTKSPILGSAAASSAPPPAPAPTRVLPNPMDSGPVAGKESGIMDPEKWCAVCERDGHDSVDCPFEDAF